jgi:hypothetical protein
METTCVLRGRSVTLREGDLLLIHRRLNPLYYAISLYGNGYSHVGTMVQRQGKLVLCSVKYLYGLCFEDPHVFADPRFKRLAVVRPHKRRTQVQAHALRLAVEECYRMDATLRHHSYDRGPREFVATLLHRQPYSETRWHCAELTARLARAVGAWPEGMTVSVDVGDVARIIGREEVIF